MSLLKPLWTEPTSGSLTYSATELRQLLDALISVDGIIRPTDLAVSQRSAGANMTVDVAAGQFACTGSSLSGQGTYLGTSTASVNCAVTANASGSTRTDLVVAQLHDDEADGSGLQSWTPVVVTNPSTGTGLPPATPANALPLAILTVANGAASIVNANITDVRAQACAVGTPYIQKGSFTITFVAGVAAGSVTFPKAFTSAPTVILSCRAITGNTPTVVNNSTVTTTTFSYAAWPAAGGSYAGTVIGYYTALL